MEGGWGGLHLVMKDVIPTKWMFMSIFPGVDVDSIAGRKGTASEVPLMYGEQSFFFYSISCTSRTEQCRLEDFSFSGEIIL